MAGEVSGVSKQISDVEPRASVVHCLSHSLNLAVQDSVRSCPLYRGMMEYVREAINMLQASTKRLGVLVRIQFQAQNTEKQLPSALRPLCPTTWTTRCQSIKSVLDNYSRLRDAFSEIASSDRSESGTKANGLLMTMEKFEFYVALRTGLLVLKRSQKC